mmetsp:Transcript_34749/g.35444  ORF Transcript_34749/g.35444 Transcript_34749/m.35444 type:complete len:405 (+) Transcript_34749:97-1311(+)|eukprot:CAMPEP_0182422210 /NCGR_PEP_ID=MMETSP1167-20130531/7816_1 /TAXON_ID=2988 /ORGANISM="Mallomonas Sp, Strain CCMP3275" /LENGTH=404 /DNA_ID=CAMNT_0024600047 /DNA_START=89 /DNA_END=1303 /DNA_ORIENTATION=-
MDNQTENNLHLSEEANHDGVGDHNAIDAFGGFVQKSIADGVEEEKCVVAQYRTTVSQKSEFQGLLKTCDIKAIPIEWVIDIADESNGWFYGTAYHFDDTTQMLHVMVPDKQNPSFDGHVPLDHRTVHLIECVDKQTDALFNKVVRDSVVKVRWEVEWFEEGAGNEVQVDDDAQAARGRWVSSTARYFIRIANQLLVEDEDFGNDSRGFVMLTCDMNVRLKRCYKGKGIEDFNRLVSEGIVQSAPDAIEYSMQNMEYRNSHSHNTPNVNPIRRLADMTRSLRECLSDLLDEREQLVAEKSKVAKAFNSFVLSGDMDAGLKIMSHVDEISLKEKKKSVDNEQDIMEAAADEAWYLCQRLEKTTSKMSKTGEFHTNDDTDHLRKQIKKLQKELEEKDRELDMIQGRS